MCFKSAPGRILCPGCARGLRAAPERSLPGGPRLVAAFEHEGAARSMVHGLKYRGITGYADLVARVLGPTLPKLQLVPIPRVWSRRILYGIDPARELAASLGRVMGVPVVDLLRAPLHARRRAGGDHTGRPPRFHPKRMPSGPYALVDDVVTTGATVLAAAEILGKERLALVIAANSADTCLVSRLSG